MSKIFLHVDAALDYLFKERRNGERTREFLRKEVAKGHTFVISEKTFFILAHLSKRGMQDFSDFTEEAIFESDFWEMCTGSEKDGGNDTEKLLDGLTEALKIADDFGCEVFVAHEYVIAREAGCEFIVSNKPEFPRLELPIRRTDPALKEYDPNAERF